MHKKAFYNFVFGFFHYDKIFSIDLGYKRCYDVSESVLRGGRLYEIIKI